MVKFISYVYYAAYRQQKKEQIMSTTRCGVHSVGNDIIDADHEKLSDLLDAFYEMTIDVTDKRVITNSLKQLIVFARDHIIYEERLMDCIAYADVATHKADHDDILKLFNTIAADIQTSNSRLPQDTAYLIATLKSEHFERHDVPFAAAIAKHELSKAVR